MCVGSADRWASVVRGVERLFNDLNFVVEVHEIAMIIEDMLFLFIGAEWLQSYEVVAELTFLYVIMPMQLISRSAHFMIVMLQ